MKSNKLEKKLNIWVIQPIHDGHYEIIKKAIKKNAKLQF